MNRTHRIICNESRQAFVVASEKTKGKGKPPSTIKPVVSAVAMALAALAAEPALAAPCPAAATNLISVTGLVSTPCTLAGNDSLTVTNTGSITAAATGVMVTGNVTAGSITNNGIITPSTNGIFLSAATGAPPPAYFSSVTSITNGGTISAASAGISLFSYSKVTGAIINNGTIAATSASGYPIWLNFNSSAGSITNTGTLIGGGGTGGVGIAVRVASSVTGSITNSGTISAGGQGIIISGASTVGGIVNQATGAISATGTASGTGIAIRSASTTVGSISNSGTISAIGRGIYVTNSGTITNAITNQANGTISGTGTAGNGIEIRGGSTPGSISNSGTISGGTVTGAGILVGTASTVGSITNSGTISGTKAISVIGGATLNNIFIGGNDTASFVGPVVAAATPMAINAGATYTLKTTDAFTVLSFTNNGTAKFAAGASSFDLTNVVSSAFTNNGTLQVVAGGTGTITGDYTQAATGTFQTDVTNDTTYGKLVVTGIATLPTNAKINVNVANPNFAFTATSMTGIITAGTLVSDGTFAVTDNSTLFNFTASKNGNAVDLTLAAAPAAVAAAVTSTSVASSGNTSGLGAATVLDALAVAYAGGGTGNTDMDTVIAALGALTTNQQLSDATLQTIPQMGSNITQAAFASTHGASQAVQSHMAESNGLSSGDSFVTDRNSWIKPLGSWADQKNRSGAFGFGAQTYGVALGADGEQSKDYRIGAAFAYTNSKVDSNSSTQTARVNSYQAILYGSSNLDGNTGLNWQADYGYNQNKGNRYIAFVNRNAVADYTSNSFHLGAGVEHRVAMSEQTSFIPSIRADYTSVRDKGYTETGAGALNLAVNGKTTEELVLAVDGKVAHALSGTATMTANAGVGYDARAKQSSITASFAGGGAAFTTTGINPSSTLLRGGLGYVTKTGGGTEITARYDVESRSGFTGQTASVKFRMPF